MARAKDPTGAIPGDTPVRRGTVKAKVSEEATPTMRNMGKRAKDHDEAILGTSDTPGIPPNDLGPPS